MKGLLLFLLPVALAAQPFANNEFKVINIKTSRDVLTTTEGSVVSFTTNQSANFKVMVKGNCDEGKISTGANSIGTATGGQKTSFVIVARDLEENLNRISICFLKKKKLVYRYLLQLDKDVTKPLHSMQVNARGELQAQCQDRSGCRQFDLQKKKEIKSIPLSGDVNELVTFASPFKGDYYKLRYRAKDGVGNVADWQNITYSYWTLSRLSIETAPLFSTSSQLGFGGGLTLAFERGLDDMFDAARNSIYFPGVRLSVASYGLFKGNSELVGIAPLIGPLWRVPLGEKHAGKLLFSAEGGLVFFASNSLDQQESAAMFQLAGGYEYPWQKSSIAIKAYSQFDVVQKLSFGLALAVYYNL